MTGFKRLYPIYLLFLFAIVNSYLLIAQIPILLSAVIPIFLLICTFAGVLTVQTAKFHLRVLNHGVTLLRLFVHSLIPSALFHTILLIILPQGEKITVLWSVLYCTAFLFVLFWVGIICVYLTSLQLGIKQRVVGVICGMIPIANLIALSGIIKTVKKEVCFEAEKESLNVSRKDEKICATKYPLLMVHGVFFRDTRYFNYWGRVPAELISNGAAVYYGEHESAAPIEESAKELLLRIKQIVNETGCEKVNIIAHSKGGLDCRFAIENLGAAEYIASLATVNTPHRGCLFADDLLTKIPESIKNKVAGAYNASLRKFGDKNPDFIAAVTDLTAKSCAERFPENTLPEGVFCQSIGSTLKVAGGGKFPLNFSYHLVKHYDGANDGLVSENSFKWGENHTHLTPPHLRGISHGDMIDLNRENIDGFDVREFYVKLVADLKSRGL